MKEWIDIIREVENRLDENIQFALATIIQVEGSAYRSSGARMLVLEDGTWIGGISGGCLEGDLLKKAQKAIIEEKSLLITYDTREDDPFQLGVGLGCNGKIDIILESNREAIVSFIHVLKEILNSKNGGYIEHQWNLKNHSQKLTHTVFKEKIKMERNEASLSDEISFKEYIKPIYQLWVFGVSFDSPSVIEMGLNLGWRINWVGNTNKMSPQLKSRCFAFYNWDDDLPISSEHLIIMMTHDVDRDISILNNLAKYKQFAYFGSLGPLKRWEKLMGLVDPNTRDIFDDMEVSTPIGLKIGAEGPYQIAISIFSEILKIVNK